MEVPDVVAPQHRRHTFSQFGKSGYKAKRSSTTVPSATTSSRRSRPRRSSSGSLNEDEPTGNHHRGGGGGDDPDDYDSDEWCSVSQVKTDDDRRVHVWENDSGYHAEVVNLKLSELVLGQLERVRWKSLTRNIDFNHDPGPIPWNFPCTSSVGVEVGRPAEEQVLDDDAALSRDPQPSSSSAAIPKARKISVGRPLCVDQSSGESDFMATDVSDNEYDDESKDKTADAVVNTLLRHYEERAALAQNEEELASIVSFADAPQHLLPMPKLSDFQVPVDEIYTVDGKRIRLRGTAVWAPPKKKFIFDIPKITDTQKLLTLQHHRCAGCGMRFTKLYERRARLCSYYNRLFCQCCFVGQKTRIPARILHQWNFREFPVSDVAFNFLTEHSNHPVYNVRAVNSDLLKQIKNLRKIRVLRIKASHMWQFVTRCSEAAATLTTCGNLKTMFDSVPKRFLSLDEIDVYSITDLEAVESGNLACMLEPLVLYGSKHIEACIECAQRSFLCELCFDVQDLLFSFQLEHIHQCEGCGALSHLKCYRSQKDHKCARCDRINRKYQLQRARTPSRSSLLDAD